MYLRAGEKTITTFRKHWLVMLFEFFLFALIAALPVLVFLVSWAGLDLVLIPALESVLKILFITWALFMWLGFSIVMTDYFLDVWILTSERLVDVEQKGLFAREVATIPLDKIQDVVVNVTGLIPTIFNYGEVHVQSAGSNKEFIIRYARHPQKIKDLILREQEKKQSQAQPVRVV